MKKIVAIFLVLLLLTGCIQQSVPTSGEIELPPKTVRQIVLRSGIMTVQEVQNADLQMRTYRHPNGDTVIMGRWQGTGREKTLYSRTVPGGKVRWYDASAGQWREEALSVGDYEDSMLELDLGTDGDLLVYLPKAYRQQKNGVLEYCPEENGFLRVEKDGEQWLLQVMASDGGNCIMDFAVVEGGAPLLDWIHPNCGDLWKNYIMEDPGKGVWCFDGYYWPCPDNYEPSGDNMLYCCPAAYLVKSFAYAASVHRAAEVLAVAMLDTMALRQNSQGYWETTPRSQWLQASYGIDAEFYDTRFNADLIEIYGHYYAAFGGDTLLQTMQRYADFFVQYAEQTHFETENGGWFVPDYFHWQPHAKPHCSLNHQLAHCIELYRLSDLLSKPSLTELADRMLRAVEDTQSHWIRADGDLHYAVFPDGSFDLPDYPYLTYNDMLEMQQVLQQHGKMPSEALTALMATKKVWMDRNSVTGYGE